MNIGTITGRGRCRRAVRVIARRDRQDDPTGDGEGGYPGGEQEPSGDDTPSQPTEESGTPEQTSDAEDPSTQEP